MERILALYVAPSSFPEDGLDINEPTYPIPLAIAAARFDQNGNMLNMFSTFVIPADDRTAARNAIEHHGITPALASREGIREMTALTTVGVMVRASTMIVSYSRMPVNVLRAALRRNKKNSDYIFHAGVRVVDVMEHSKLIVKKPRLWNGEPTGDYANPKMGEAFEKMFGRTIPSVLSPAGYIMSCAELFQEMVNRDLIELKGGYDE